MITNLPNNLDIDLNDLHAAMPNAGGHPLSGQVDMNSLQAAYSG